MSLVTRENEEAVIGILKFVHPNFAEDFEKSQLFFNNLQRFHEIEHHEIGDNLEGVISNKLGNKYDPNDEVEVYVRNLEVPNAKIHKVNVKEVTLKHTSNIVKDFKICCFSIIILRDLVESDDGNYRLSQEFIQKMKGIIDNRNIYFTIHSEDFINKLSRTFSEKDIYFKSSIVKYFEDKHPLFYKIENGEKLLVKDFIDASFYKTNKYSNQNEFRILTYKLKGNKVKIQGLYNNFKKLEGLDQLVIGIYTEEEYKNLNK
ncbi:hypothetical protein [Staphylococcus chromogenes]|uniref:hypothetical protein n=1 Tax=Staphylococcus chromogenes TaxID=46126 RepID=UPI002DBB9173|nr:hypothetical protein [Staphylococcus chromogenes]MEB7824808.1 hypothetical protein [Staphylococcus chromogenes]